ncbi:Ribosomal protein L9/RNase H1, N-terminal [Sesbania bispinosa]|nr:Ribosomal protein L9/RNase H1, N-terminal [Sesbania bispinosa]
MAKKLYVVFVGRKPGFYDSWSECQNQVIGYSGNLYQGFHTREEAYNAWMRYWATENIDAAHEGVNATHGTGFGGNETFPMPVGLNDNESSGGVTT